MIDTTDGSNRMPSYGNYKNVKPKVMTPALHDIAVNDPYFFNSRSQRQDGL